MSAFYLTGVIVALSFSATVGYFTSALLSYSKIRDLEFAYLKLAKAIRRFLGEIPAGECGMVIYGDDDVAAMRKTLDDADRLAGFWTIEDYRR
jgi:hypothetical protein